ncbi:hypothetical protein B0A54_15198 [Friedmanniomyces endolithicus]|uniref:Uncharacterized protein n=1 Tax=Friedmanniomyces endolithicus TaxID=329885 RepID=A0A4U0U622_9PEZI|nr:hypothetical protein LTS09_014893 [Friedmanniomyces endolithicus]TKA30613.1 hypothetical protein B0A54_15198 [Friedmanniomyces endolithicus]
MSTQDVSRSQRMLSTVFALTGRKRTRADSDPDTPAADRPSSDSKRQRRMPWKPRNAARDAMSSIGVTHRVDSPSQLFVVQQARRGSAPAQQTGEQRATGAYKPRYAGRDAMLAFSVAQRDDVTAKIRENARRASDAAELAPVGTEYRRALSETGMNLVGLPNAAGQGVFSSFGGRWLSTGSGGVSTENRKVRLWGRDAGHAESVSLGAPSPKASAGDLRTMRRSQSALAMVGSGSAPVSREEAEIAAAFRRLDGGDFDLAPFGRPRQTLRHAVSQPGLVGPHPDAPPHPLHSVASSQAISPYTYRADLTPREISADHIRTAAMAPARQPTRPPPQPRTTSYADLTAQRRGPTRPLMPRAATAAAVVLTGGKGKERAVEVLSVITRQPASVAPVSASPSSTLGVAAVASPVAKDSRQQSVVVNTSMAAEQGKPAPQEPSRPASEKEEPISSSSSKSSARSSLTSLVPGTTPPTPMSTKAAVANAEALSPRQVISGEDMQVDADDVLEEERRRDPVEELKEFLKRSLAL